LTLDQALQYAIDHYPAVRAAREGIDASAAGVEVARAAYLPRLDTLWQSNRATANNIFGQLLPQNVIPAISGPVLSSASATSVWGSATGALISWEAFDFGLRKATVVGAEAALEQARAGEALTRLEVQHAVASAFLSLAWAERAVVAAQADLDRRDVLLRVVRTLVENQLRPGADASRAEAERAASSTRLIQAQEVQALARTSLARLLGVATSGVAIQAEELIQRAPLGEVPTEGVAGHPLVRTRQAAVEAARAQQEVLAYTDRPRVYVQSSVYARGSGADANGHLDSGLAGLGLDRANWAAGVQIWFPNAFDFSSLRARRAAAAAGERAGVALHDEAVLAVTSEREAAAVRVKAARAIAANTPVQLAAAEQSETQARARYQAGLATLAEVADAQGLLAQAQILDALGRVDVWRALLLDAVAQGDLTPFRDLVRPRPGER